MHLSLLKLLLSDIDKELSRGFYSHASKNGKFLGLLHSVSMFKSCIVKVVIFVFVILHSIPLVEAAQVGYYIISIIILVHMQK